MSRRRTKTGGRAATEGVIPGRYALSVGDPGSPLPDGWHWTRLLDVARLETGHTPSRRKPEYWGGDIPWIGIKDARVHHGRDIYSTNEATNQLGIDNSAARVLPVDTVCLSRTASIGYITRTKRLMCTSQDFVNWVCDESGLTSRYLMYVLLAEVESLFRFAHGTSHQTIYFPEVKAFHAALPPIDEQRRIAAVLGALDDKIEVNRQMSQTLEEMAQAVFESWFVDFDGHGSSELVDSELGAIPRGWSVCALGDLLQLKRGYDLPKRERIEGDVPIVSSSGVSGAHNEAKVEAPGVVVGRYGTIGQVFFVEDDFWPLNTSLYVRDFKGSPQRFIFHLLRGVNWHAYTGKSAVPGVNRNHVHRERIVCPPVTRRTQFDAAVAPLWQRHSANERASQTLAELRDTLLPKLISGEIRVPEAEAAVEAAL